MSEHVNGGALNEEQRDEQRSHTEPPILGLEVGKGLFLWGEELHVKRCPPNASALGCTGVLRAPESWRDSDIVGELHIGILTHLLRRSWVQDGWVFSRKLDDGEPTALRRAREIYDHDAFVADLDSAVREIRDLLVQKNQAYGNSALDPVRIFSKADPMEQLFVRIDDKLSRLKRGHAAGEDVVKDLQGYLLLVRVAQMRAERSKT